MDHDLIDNMSELITFLSVISEARLTARENELIDTQSNPDDPESHKDNVVVRLISQIFWDFRR